MMFLRNLVLVTLLAASATAGRKKACGYKCKLGKACLKAGAPRKVCYNQAAYNYCEANIGKAWFSKSWFETLSNPVLRKRALFPAKTDDQEALQEVKPETGIFQGALLAGHPLIRSSDCSTTPAVCILSKFEEDRNSVQLSVEEDTFRDHSEYQCFERIAVHECMLENKRMYTSISREEATRRVKAALNNIKSGENKFAPMQCMNGEGRKTYLDGIQVYLQRFKKTSNQLRTYYKATERKTIETAKNSPAKNSQKTTGSSDNTVLIVVVALLSVFALAVGVWVGRLSSEMKIPQDAQMGPVGIETV